MNRFKGLDLVDGVSEELWTKVHCIIQEGVSDQKHPKEKETQEGKGVICGSFTNSWEKKRSERQRRKRKIYPTEWRVLETRKEKYEGLLQWTMQRSKGK